jgi:LmbE family N-acetylglucosaminyl deacetylase
MNAGKTALVVSPHLDDGVISTGLTILALRQAGWTVIVATVFSTAVRNDATRVAIHFNGRDGDVLAGLEHRRKEDNEAVSALGAVPVHLGFLDASFRRSDSGEWLLPDLRSAVAPPAAREDELVQAIASRLRQITKGSDVALVIGPLGIGSHVDHLVVKRAIHLLAKDQRTQYVFYEDLPYAATRETTDGDLVTGLTPVLISGTIGSHDRKLRAIALYKSQTRFFPLGKAGTWQGLLADYSNSLTVTPAERLWREGEIDGALERISYCDHGES